MQECFVATFCEDLDYIFFTDNLYHNWSQEVQIYSGPYLIFSRDILVSPDMETWKHSSGT